MAKPALGRGLNILLKGRKDAPSEAAPAPGPPPLSPGMAALLRRDSNGAESQGDEVAEKPVPSPQQENGGKELPLSSNTSIAQAKAPAPSFGKVVLRISLISADVILLALVAQLAFLGPGPVGVTEIATCVFALVIGAWLACLALWL